MHARNFIYQFHCYLKHMIFPRFINWENVKTLDNERHFHKRMISEVLHKKSQRNRLNA